VRPYVIYDENTYGKVTGHAEDVLNIVRENLNFSTIVLKPPDGQFGAPINGTQRFSGCIGELQNGKADLAVVFAVTNLRYAVVDYLDDYLYSSNNILVRIPPPASKIWNVFTPMTLQVWLLLAASIFIVPFIIYLLALFSPFSAWNLKLSFAFADEVWYKEYLWSTIGSFLQQGQDFYPFAMSPRTVMVFWWLLTVIIFGAYTGDLTAHLATSVSSLTIRTLEDLVSMPYYTALVPRGTNIHTAIDMATSGPMFQLKSMTVLVQSHEDCARKLLASTNPYTVCIADQKSNLYFANQFCEKMYVADEYFNFYYLAWPVPKDAFYADAMNLIIRRAKENGLVDMLRLKYFPTSSSECSSAQGGISDAEPINLEGIGGSCLVPGVLYLIGLLILLLELFWTACLNKDPLQCVLF
uniref:Lig_chan-Glu_bd domain-containing protein n=1 Tax=Macrostomum lignano TaxID=282301 RepID=A0A1I8JJ64_9PLAT